MDNYILSKNLVYFSHCTPNGDIVVTDRKTSENLDIDLQQGRQVNLLECAPSGVKNVQLQYEYGYTTEEVPQDIKGVCIRWVNQQYQQFLN